MLSKIKSAAAAAAAQETRTQASDNEETEIDNDTNNNNNNNNNNMNNNGKKNQDELLDIVEVSRKRRLSKGSADSLTGFIRWSFSHLDHPESIQLRHQPDGKFRQSPTKNSSDEQLEADDLDEEMLDDNIEDWPRQFSNNNNRSSFQVPDNTLPRKLSAAAAAAATGGGSSAANLALIKAAAGGQLANLGGLLTEVRANNKRPRSQVYSPDSSPSKFMSAGLNGSQRKTSSYLGNVVERLHHQQSLAQQLQQQQQQELSSQQDIDTESGPASGLSFHLQQFLQQQTSLEDLCSSVNLVDQDNNQQQLALAAAIHRALVDSVGHNQVGAGLADAKSTASSTGSSNGTGSSSSTISQLNLSSQQVSALSAAATSANFTTHHHHHQQQHQLDSAMDRQRRVYNTRAALHGLAQGVGPAHTGSRLNQHHHLHSNNNSINHLNSHQHNQNGLAAMNMSNRVQQQRHAQAAAALSALAASAGSHSHPLHLAAAAAAAAGATPTTPIVDFKCDTCPSSFDDRHRLMQHQSIHLELKKDWFTETPVDEVMKIFNRRRGEFLCNICNLRFEATLDYDQHNHSVHGPRPYCCQFCGNGTRTFKCWRQYLNHLYDHRYIFSCTIDDCDFTVNRRDSLRFHIFRFHLNCQLPQNNNNNQQSSQQQRSAHNSVPLMLGNGDPLANKWSSVMDDEDDDTENEMNVAD